MLLALPVKFGGSGLQKICEDFCEEANIELVNSKKIIGELYENIISQKKDFQIDNEKTKAIKNELKTKKILNYKIKLGQMKNSMKEKIRRCNNISNQTGPSNWLSEIPMREINYVLNKQQFWDSIKLRYDGLFQAYRLVARVEKASIFSTPCHGGRENSLPRDTTI